MMRKVKLMMKSLLRMVMMLNITMIPLHLLKEVMMKVLLARKHKVLGMEEKMLKVKELLQRVILTRVLVKV